MSPQLLQHVGASLYGGRWHAQLARDLNVSERSIYYWEATGRVPVTVPDMLRRIIGERAVILAELLLQLD